MMGDRFEVAKEVDDRQRIPNATASPPAPGAMPVSAPMLAASPRAWPARACSAWDSTGSRNATELAAALGGLKGPIMKVAQLLATIPEALPPEYIEQLDQACRTKRRRWAGPSSNAACRPSLARTGSRKFEIFEHQPAAAASLGQVHRATALDGTRARLQAAISRHAVGGRSGPAPAWHAVRDPPAASIPAIDTREIIKEIGARVREELDYRREAKHVALYRDILKDEPAVRVPRAWPELSTGRLLTLDWLDGTALLDHKDASLDVRNRLAQRDVHGLVAAVQPLWRHPRRSASGQLQRLHRERRTRRHQPPRLRLHPHLPALFRRRRGRSLQWPAHEATTRGWSMPTRPGASASYRAS